MTPLRTPRPGRPAALPAVLLPAGDGLQSALTPAGPHAGRLLDLGHVLFVGGTAVFVVTMAALVWALATARKPADARQDRRRTFGLIVAGGVVMPVVVLTALMVHTFVIGRTLTVSAAGDEPLRIEVVGRRWWWEVRYPTADGGVVTANEIHIPVGRTVEVVLTSPNVIHSFWVPSLAGKLDLIPGRTNRLAFRADEAGVFRGQCAEFCGIQHAMMAFYLFARPPAEFDGWLARQAQPARKPDTPLLEAGQRAFLDAGCPACHVVRGLTDGAPVGDVVGPDLTHVGSRHSIAAGSLPNTVGAFAGWIAGSQTIKPGNHMPSYRQFDGETLRALAAWLESLE